MEYKKLSQRSFLKNIEDLTFPKDAKPGVNNAPGKAANPPFPELDIADPPGSSPCPGLHSHFPFIATYPGSSGEASTVAHSKYEFRTFATQSVALGPVASASSGDFLRIQNLSPCPKLAEPKPAF